MQGSAIPDNLPSIMKIYVVFILITTGPIIFTFHMKTP